VLAATAMLTLGLFLAPLALGAVLAGLLVAIGVGFAASLAAFAVAEPGAGAETRKPAGDEANGDEPGGSLRVAEPPRGGENGYPEAA
jgi:hypothetical protein